jgi:hypothetical protein
MSVCDGKTTKRKPPYLAVLSTYYFILYSLGLNNDILSVMPYITFLILKFIILNYPKLKPSSQLGGECGYVNKWPG